MAGSFKGLNRSEVFLTDYNSQKNWEASGSDLSSLGIEHIKAYSGSVWFNNVLYHNYYSGSNSDGSFTGSADLYLQTTLTIPGARQLPANGYAEEETASVVIFSVPADLVGTRLEAGSVTFFPREDTPCYVEEGYVVEEESKRDPHYFEDLPITPISDKDGVLLSDGWAGNYEKVEGFNYPVPSREKGRVVGDVIYGHGLIVITDPFWSWLFGKVDKDGNVAALKTVRWTSNVPIHTYNVSCKVRDHEFNYTYNRTAKKLIGTEDFTPYVTSLGLYNNRNELVAVAKLSKPIKKLDNIDMTFNVRVDIS